MIKSDRWALGIAFGSVVIAAALIARALAQPAGGVVNLPSPLTGNEIVTVLPLQGNGQPGAVNANVTLAQIANFVANHTVSTAASGTAAMTTPSLILTVPLTAALAVTLPAMPTDGEVAVVSNQSGGNFTQTVTVTTVTPAAGGVLVNMPANGSARFRYTAATMTWTRIA